MQRQILAGLIGLMAAGSAMAGRLDMNVSDETVFLQGGTEIGYSLFGPDEQGDTRVYGGLLYNEDRHRAFHLGLEAEGRFRDVPLEIALGPRLYYVRMDSDTEGGAGTLGGRLRFAPDAWNGLGLSAAGQFAPKVLAFSDLERLHEWDVRVDYQLFPRGMIYAGYRELKLRDEDEGSRTVDDAFHVGFQIEF